LVKKETKQQLHVYIFLFLLLPSNVTGGKKLRQLLYEWKVVFAKYIELLCCAFLHAKQYTQILGLSEMSSGKWNYAYLISEEFAMMKITLVMVPLFFITLIASMKGSNICRWNAALKCSPSYRSPPPSNSTLQSKLHQYVRPHFSSICFQSLTMVIFFNVILKMIINTQQNY